jgi:hypothetical protein
MVGIGGGAPSQTHDIRLGEVVVSSPQGTTGGVIHYEFGKTKQNQKFQLTGSLDVPPSFVLTALSDIETQHLRRGHRIAQSIEHILARNPRLKKQYEHPQSHEDRLYKADFVHPAEGKACSEVCGEHSSQLVTRRARDKNQIDPAIHYGLIASADHLMKDARIRNNVTQERDGGCRPDEQFPLRSYPTDL